MFNFLNNISAKEVVVLVVIVVVLIIFFGKKGVVGIGKSSGETFKEIKKIKKNFTDATKDDESDS
jgi:Sec-independent protein translocase protein TatA